MFCCLDEGDDMFELYNVLVDHSIAVPILSLKVEIVRCK